jgi:hypothetical protein
MHPLRTLALGLVIVGLTATVDGYDLLADPVGWALVLVAVPRLALPRAGAVVLLATAALAVSVPLWLPGVRSALNDADPSLPWAATLPQLGFCVLFCQGLATAALADEDRRAGAWLRTLAVLFVVVALLPVLVWGAGIDGLEAASYVLAALVLVALVCGLFTWSGRPWAGYVAPAADPQ